MTLLVTGLGGFVGHSVKNELDQYGVKYLAPSSKELDLTRQDAVLNYFSNHRDIDSILHLAAKAAGIGGNMAAPADFIQINNAMTVNLFDAVYRYDIEYFYGLGSVCSYPCFCPVPFKEENLWEGEPESSNKPYSIGKRALLMTQQAFRQQYGTKGVHLLPANLYGIHDNFNLKTSHVIPALIRKFHEAKLNNSQYVECWGTGEASRAFLYSKDLSKLLLRVVTEKIDYPEPINVGPPDSIKIKNLAELIKKITEYKGEIKFTGEVSDGQMKRQLDISRAKNILGFEITTTLEEGLKETYKWYLDNFKEIK